MVKFKSFVGALLAGALLAVPASAQKARRGDQDDAWQALHNKAERPLRSIENSIVPGMKARGADYIGPEYHAEESRYRLKFMHGSSVIWIDVDAKSGNVVGRAGE